MNYNGNMVIYLVLAANLMTALAYVIIMYWKTKRNYVFIRGGIMACCPVTALCCYFFSYIQDLVVSEKEVDYMNLSMDKTRKQFEQAVDKETEMKMLPLEEVLTVSTTRDRREAMINLLKTDVSDRLSLIRKAVENEDPETAHYAASALTDIFGRFTAEVNKLQGAYDKDRANREINEEYIDVVMRILGSGALFGVEELSYLYIYTGLVENLMGYHPGAVTSEHMAMMVKALYREGKSAEAEKWAEMSLEKWPDEEQPYMNILYIKYYLGKEEDFYKCLKELADSGIALSRKGLDIIRFWLKR
ncbi:hypothetical protein IMSAG249_00626 [Lachnospiraceae bacterium]|nr:hypothetical protein IMSAG249_00626 [Lachnospiraceae bacterium]